MCVCRPESSHLQSSVFKEARENDVVNQWSGRVTILTDGRRPWQKMYLDREICRIGREQGKME